MFNICDSEEILFFLLCRVILNIQKEKKSLLFCGLFSYNPESAFINIDKWIQISSKQLFFPEVLHAAIYHTL